MTLYLQNHSDIDKTIKLEGKIVKIEKKKEITITDAQIKELLTSRINRKMNLTISTKSMNVKIEDVKIEETKKSDKSKVNKIEETNNKETSQTIETK